MTHTHTHTVQSGWSRWPSRCRKLGNSAPTGNAGQAADSTPAKSKTACCTSATCLQVRPRAWALSLAAARITAISRPRKCGSQTPHRANHWGGGLGGYRTGKDRACPGVAQDQLPVGTRYGRCLGDRWCRDRRDRHEKLPHTGRYLLGQALYLQTTSSVTPRAVV